MLDVLFFSGLIIFLFWFGYKTADIFLKALKLSISSKKWQTVEGFIITARVVRSPSYDNGVTHTPVLKYSYIVDGKEYTSNKLSPASFTDILEVIHSAGTNWLRQYPEKESVTVYYNPEEPEKAILEPGINSIIFLPLIVTVICGSLICLLYITLGMFIPFFIAGAIILGGFIYSWLRNKRKENKKDEIVYENNRQDK